LIFFFGGAPASEAHAGPGQVGLEVSPLSVEKEVERGEELTFAVKFRNPLNEVQHIRPKFKDIHVQENGEIVFLDYSSPRYTISRWASFPKEVIELKPNEERTVPVTVRVPTDATLGGHFAGFFGEARVKDGGTFRGPYGVEQRVAPGCLVLLSVGDESILGVSTEWEGDMQLSLEGAKFAGFYIASRPIQVNITFSNRGIFHQNVWGGVFVRNSFWKDEKSLRLSEKKVLPDAHISYSKQVTPRRILGKYTVQAKLLYGRHCEKELIEEKVFWVLNPWFCTIIILTPILAFIWVKYIRVRQQ
jgi:hypothetical protein